MVLALIGAGNMGSALVRGFVTADLIKASSIRLYDLDINKASQLAQTTGATVSQSALEAATGADIVLMAVKPQYFSNAMSSVAAALTSQSLVVSIAAGITLDQLRNMAGPEAALARVMPNTPALVGSGVSAVCFDQASNKQQAVVEDLLKSCGIALKVNENLMDAVTGLSGSGPAYVMLMIEALADGGVLQGLPRDKAIEMAAMTLKGSAELVLETGLHPAVLKDQVCSPAGTTIEAIKCLENDGMRASLINAVCASSEKSRKMNEMGK